MIKKTMEKLPIKNETTLSDSLTKPEMRSYFLNKRNQTPFKERERLDGWIVSHIIHSDAFAKCSILLIFVGFGSEVNTSEIIEAAIAQKKKVYVPRVLSMHGMEFFRILSFDKMVRSKYGILEPAPENTDKLLPGEFRNKVDEMLAIVPGIAFDREGNRIGYGRGYYDRYFTKIRKMYGKKRLPYRIGLCYDLQMALSIPADDGDVAMNAICTEKGIREL